MYIDVIRLLSKGTANSYAEKIKRRETLWIPRGGFYTIGASTYLDDPKAYPARAKQLNSETKALWGQLWYQLTNAMPRHWVPKQAVHHPCTAFMGAHIFTPETNGTTGHPHTDEPYERVNWGQNFSNPFSFTLALEMPAAGGGLDFWAGVTDEDIDLYNQASELPPHEHMRYEEGFLYIHDGLTPHRIANCGDMEKGEHRITLQGHGVTLEDGNTAIYF